EEGPQVRSKIIEKTQMPEEDFFGAIGWLARENKIRKDKRTFKVGDTNLTEKIGEDAGKVWEVLHKRNDLDISGIARLSKVKKRDCYSAIGWLAREGKITAKVAVRKK
ncbi:MAG: winged helix-turn-helix domain-containing protein, partial [Candidatus Thermoplasmatota archaeon]|nr:winged helix-turn-helix domain-containing protein [Candidatus Thermoplasmatota archaeon]